MMPMMITIVIRLHDDDCDYYKYDGNYERDDYIHNDYDAWDAYAIWCSDHYNDYMTLSITIIRTALLMMLYID